MFEKLKFIYDLIAIKTECLNVAPFLLLNALKAGLMSDCCY
jgi:hypothetical protein